MGGRDSLIAMPNAENMWHPLQPYLIEGLNMQHDIDLGLEVDEARREFLWNIFKPLDVTEHEDLLLFKYKGYVELADLGYGRDFFDLYDGLYRECRSVVFDRTTGEVVLAALAKFKNYGEEENSGDWTKQCCNAHYFSAKKVYITDKMDGSYQQYRYRLVGDALDFYGSGSQALDPEQSWRLKRGRELILKNDLDFVMSLFPDWTFIFEYVSPDNPVVVKYSWEQEGLYLFAMRNVKTGKEKTFEEIRQIVDQFAIRNVTTWFKGETLQSILNSTAFYKSSEKEGWVVDCVDDTGKHFRFKIKTDDYVLMHKALSNLISPNAVVEAVYNGRYDDFLAKCPDAYHEVIGGYYNTIQNYIHLYGDLSRYYIYRMRSDMGTTDIQTKDAMIWFNDHAPKCVRETSRAMYLNRPVSYLCKGSQNSLKSFGEITKHLEELEKYMPLVRDPVAYKKQNYKEGDDSFGS